MLGPVALTVGQYKVATKPSAGWEKQLWVTELSHTDLGQFVCLGPNSGVYTPNVADNNVLATNPQELVAVLQSDVLSASALTVTVTGLDNFNNPGTWTASFTPPAYSQNQAISFPKTYAVDLIPSTLAATCSVIQSVAVTCGADAAFLPIEIVGIPSISVAAGTSFNPNGYKLMGDKMTLDVTFKIPEPHPVQSSRDKGAYIKKGEIPVPTINFRSKEKTMVDTIARLNGKRVTGVVREIKEGTVETSRLYLLGLILTAKESTGESVEDVTLDSANGLCEIQAMMPAK